MADLAGESNGDALRLDFDRRLTLQFRGSVVTSGLPEARNRRRLGLNWQVSGGCQIMAHPPQEVNPRSARGHFAVRRLEGRHGIETVQRSTSG
ncbi:MAG TPA: hypothetical protein VKS78_01470 [Roseiarcus sp.]|nr:hypothetical protein [Roseiarcus sp.]